MTRSMLFALAVAVASAPGVAQINHILETSYQGRLTEGGAPAVGDYIFKVTIYDAVSGGNALAEETRAYTIAPGDDGVFTLEELYFGSAFIGPDVWLGVTVTADLNGNGVKDGAETSYVLYPRHPVTAAPLAVAAEYAYGSGTGLDSAYDNGNIIQNGGKADVKIEGGLDVGTPGSDGEVEVYSSSVGSSAILRLERLSTDGGSLRVFDENGSTIGSMEADGSGEGLYIYAKGDGGSMIWNGDRSLSGTNSGSQLTISGPGSTSNWRTDLSGDDSVQLPIGAIDAVEMSNEPGLANHYANALNVGVTVSTSALFQRTITAPSSGYIVAIATVEVFHGHSSGTASGYTLGLSTTAGVYERGLEYQFDYDADFPTDASVSRFHTIHGTFPVLSGSTTIYLNGSVFGAVFYPTSLGDVDLTLVYVPTSYGDVGTGGSIIEPLMAPGVDDEWINAATPRVYLGAAEMVAERESSIAANDERVLAELESMRRRVEALEQQVGQGAGVGPEQ